MDDDLPTADDLARDMGEFGDGDGLDAGLDDIDERPPDDAFGGFGDLEGSQEPLFGGIDEQPRGGMGFGDIDERPPDGAFGAFDAEPAQEPLFGGDGSGSLFGDAGGDGDGGDGGGLSLRELFGGGDREPGPEAGTNSSEDDVEIVVGSTGGEGDEPADPQDETDSIDEVPAGERSSGRTVSAATVGEGIDRAGSSVRRGLGRVKRGFRRRLP